MLKNNRMCFIIFIFFIGVALAHERHQQVEQKKSSTDRQKETLIQINQKYVESIKAIFKKSCFNCHSNQTVYPFYYKMPVAKWLIDEDIAEAKKHMDMRNDFPFEGHGTPNEDLEAIAKSVTENTMPPFRYRIMHWKSGLSKEEQKLIVQWTKDSLDLLSQEEKKQ